MVEGRKKSRSLRRMQLRIPSGKNVTHYTKRKPSKAQCANCGKNLSGVIRARQSKVKNSSKSQKRPSRPYGGVLCSRCARQTIVNKFRNIFTLKSE